MITSTRLTPPDSIKLPTRKKPCPECNSEGKYEIYTSKHDPGATKFVDCENRDCEDGLIEVPAIAFVVYDCKHECWLGYDPAQDDFAEDQIFQAYEQDDAAEYTLWQDAEENVNAYCKKFGLSLSDLSFDDALQVDPTL